MTEPQADANHAPEEREFLCFEVGSQAFCIDIMAVRELRGWSPSTPIPRAPPYMRGVVNLRGVVLPILDVAARLGLPGPEPTPRHVIVVAAIGARTMGLLVDSVSGIVSLGSDALQAAPRIDRTDDGFVTSLFTVDDRMIGLLSLERLPPGESAEAA